MSTLETNLVQPSTGTALTIGASGDTITVPSGATFNVAGTLQSGGSAITQGITEADLFMLTSDLSLSANVAATLTGLARPSSGNYSSVFGRIGTGLSMSSGVLSFTNTGIYRVEFYSTFMNSSASNPRYCQNYY